MATRRALNLLFRPLKVSIFKIIKEKVIQPFIYHDVYKGIDRFYDTIFEYNTRCEIMFIKRDFVSSSPLPY
jgi:hypothetical protein